MTADTITADYISGEDDRVSTDTLKAVAVLVQAAHAQRGWPYPFIVNLYGANNAKVFLKASWDSDDDSVLLSIKAAQSDDQAPLAFPITARVISESIKRGVEAIIAESGSTH